VSSELCPDLANEEDIPQSHETIVQFRPELEQLCESSSNCALFGAECRDCMGRGQTGPSHSEMWHLSGFIERCEVFERYMRRSPLQQKAGRGQQSPYRRSNGWSKPYLAFVPVTCTFRPHDSELRVYIPVLSCMVCGMHDIGDCLGCYPAICSLQPKCNTNSLCLLDTLEVIMMI
jgi:hypothetical protein